MSILCLRKKVNKIQDKKQLMINKTEEMINIIAEIAFKSSCRLNISEKITKIVFAILFVLQYVAFFLVSIEKKNIE